MAVGDALGAHDRSENLNLKLLSFPFPLLTPRKVRLTRNVILHPRALPWSSSSSSKANGPSLSTAEQRKVDLEGGINHLGFDEEGNGLRWMT